MKEFYEDQDLECLFDCSAEIDDFYDNKAISRALNFFDASPQVVMNSIAINVLLKEDIKPKVVHGDTTSWSVHGDYDTEDNSNKTIKNS